MVMICWRGLSSELVTVDPARAEKSEQLIESCEHFHPDDAEIPFDWILADVTDKRGASEFTLSDPARCPNCKHAITEKTLIEPKQKQHRLKMRLVWNTDYA